MPVRVKYTKGDQTVVIEFPKDTESFVINELIRSRLFPGVEAEAYDPAEEARKKTQEDVFVNRTAKEIRRGLKRK